MIPALVWNKQDGLCPKCGNEMGYEVIGIFKLKQKKNAEIMNTFSKLRKLYEYLDWKYFAWNDPDKEIEDEKQYFARNGYKHHFKRIHLSVRNDPSWNLIIWFAGKLQYKIEPTVTNNLLSYSTDDVLDSMYKRFIEDYDPKVRESLLRLQEESTHSIEKRDKY